MIMKGGSMEPPFLLPWLRNRHMANSLNLKTDQYQKLGRSLQNFRFLQKIEIGKSSRIIEVVFAGIFGRAL